MRGAQVSPAARAEARRLAALPPRALPRIALDLLAWLGLGAIASHLARCMEPVDALPAVAAIAFVIGFVPMHDLLIHGHEAVHRVAARGRTLNEALLWFLHALFGLSGAAHRAFHLAHHRRPHGPHDPEYAILSRLGARGWSFLVLPAVAPLGVYAWTFTRRQRSGVRRRVVLETIAAGALHAALVAALGPVRYLVCVLAPITLGLLPAFALRSIGEHHGAVSGHPWRYARALGGGLLGRLWSNIDHHLEHHLFPRVPTRYMPALRAALRDDYAREGVPVGPGFGATFAALVRSRTHFGPPTRAEGP